MKKYLCLLAVASHAAAGHLPVCIVGAGPAGLTAAYELEKAGRSVHVFEKMSAVGGKCQTVYDNGTYFPLGAAIYASNAYEETQKLREFLGVEAEVFASVERYAFDWKTGETSAIPPPEGPTLDLLLKEFQDYSSYWAEQFDSTIGFKNLESDELSLPTLDWMLMRDYQVLPIVFNDALTIYGYGDYKEIPMAYSLMLFTPGLLQGTIGSAPVMKMDYHQLFVRLASQIDGPIHLNANIKSINRTGKTPVIRYKLKSGKSKTQACSDIVLAFPPTVALLEEAGLDLTDEEESLFSEVGVTNYFASAVRASQMPGDIAYYGAKPDPYTPPESESQPVYIQALHPDSGVIMAYSQGGNDGPPDPERAYQLMLETIGRLNYDPRVEDPKDAEEVSEEDVLGFSGTIPYFPRVDSEAFANGFYQKLDALQGEHHTYYASSLSGFEIVEYALRAGSDVVHSYILK